MQAGTSMPCHIRCEGSISAPTFVAPVSSINFLSVTGENTRLCGCISMATRTSFARARASISLLDRPVEFGYSTRSGCRWQSGCPSGEG
jgi:hypothetical protein